MVTRMFCLIAKIYSINHNKLVELVYPEVLKDQKEKRKIQIY